MRRRLLFIFVVSLVGAIVIVGALPFWMAPAVKWAGASRGLTFGAYERVGYARFALHDAEFRRGTVRVMVSRAEVDTPMLWLWRHWRRQDPIITVANWRVEIDRSTTPANPAGERGWVPLRAQLLQVRTQLHRWLPEASAGAGIVRFPGGEIAIGSATWRGRELAVRGLAFRAIKADATVVFPANTDLIQIVAHTTDDAVAPTTAKFESSGPQASAELTVWNQPAALSATFAPKGWLPSEAVLRAADWKVPAEKLKLSPLYASVLGSAQLEWRAERIVADITARGEPLPDKSSPPLELTLRGKGDMTTFTVDSLNAMLPGIAARLSEPVTIERSGKIRESAARFTLQADLAKQPWFSATGTLNGEARLVSGLAPSPVVEFTMEARDVTAHDINLSSVAARGKMDWPRIEIAAGTVVGGEGEELRWRGGWNIRTKELLDTTVEGQLRRQSVARWMPKQPSFDVVKISAQAAGTLSALKHQGRLQAGGVKLEGFNPLDVSAEWRAAGVVVEQFKVEAVAGSSKIVAAGTAEASSLQLAEFELRQGATSRLRLAAPATIRWRPQLQLESLHLTGPTGNMTATAAAGQSGQVKISAADISSQWFSELVPTPGPPWQLTLLALVGQWDRGPMTFSLTAGATVEVGAGRTAAVMTAARGDQHGVQVEALRATEGNDTVVNATGRIPATFTPGTAPLLHIDPNGALSVEATVAPNSAFWQKLAAVSGIELQEPQASAHLSGTWQRPEGNASLKAARIAIDPKRVARSLPAIESLDLQLTGDRAGVTLNTFTVKIEGQAVHAQGRLPIPGENWAELLKEPMAAARRGADLRLEIPGADVAVFMRFLPAVLAPKGTFQADLRYKNDGIEGFVKLRDAASRPLGPFGVLQEISADIALAGRKLALRGVTARSGGQPVTLNGTVELPENSEPRFDLSLKGENLPFVRQTGLLMRGDLDLKLQSATGAQPRLSGTVRLRDSLFLTDVRAFLPKGGGTSPSRRPPYFAVETPPVNVWTLAIDVVGDEFLRLRTPVFTGIASARFRLSGTLGEPRAIGEITIDEGSVRMPFASFDVTQGAVRLTEANPFEPAVYLRGTGRRYGYDLTMEIDGPASQPNVVFTSSPALDSEQVLLMVMTGAAPNKEITKSPTQRVANIGYFLGQSLLGSLGADAGDADRLSIASGEKISRQGKETYDIEYKLSNRWTLTGEYNEFDEYNAGVKWRVFGGKRPDEDKAHATK